MDSHLPRRMTWSGTNTVIRRKQSWARRTSSPPERALPPKISRVGRRAPSRCSEGLASLFSPDDQPHKADEEREHGPDCGPPRKTGFGQCLPTSWTFRSVPHGRVGHELADFLRAAAGAGVLGSPPQGLLE